MPDGVVQMAMDDALLHERARVHGVNPLVYWLVRAILRALFHLYFRLRRVGREHLPEDVAVIGTEAVRRGWRIRPHKVRIRCGRPITFPHVEAPSAALAGTVTDRIWPCVMLQWEWLGGLPPLRRAAVIGAGAWGTGLAVMLARAGVE